MLNKISNYDIMQNDLDDLFKYPIGIKADCLYSDPPWGEANLKYWRTINNQKNYSVDWRLFLHRLKFISDRHVSGPLFIETGLRFKDDVISVFGVPIKIFECIYGNHKHKNLLLCWRDVPKIDLTNKGGVDLVYSCLSSLSFNPSVVFDPCVGLGNTARACKKIECNLFCNELNRNRMLRTMAIMEFIEC
jgi:hypothetical protein